MATHPMGPSPLRVQTFTCRRCGFDWQRPKTPGAPPAYCPECKPLVVREQAHVKGRRRRPLTPEKAALKRDRARLDRRGLSHVHRGVTVQQWVDRWHERPDLFEALCWALVRSAQRYPDWEAGLRKAA